VSRPHPFRQETSDQRSSGSGRSHRSRVAGSFNAHTLEKLLGDRLVYTHSTSQSDNRAEYIALCKKGVFRYLKIERPVENIQVYSDNIVVITGHIKIDAVIEGKPKL
jgi:hypothetical protein